MYSVSQNVIYFLRSLIPYLVCACLLTSPFCLHQIHQVQLLLHCSTLQKQLKKVLFIEFREKHIFLVKKWSAKQPFNFYVQSQVFDRNLVNTNFSPQLPAWPYSPLDNHNSVKEFLLFQCSLPQSRECDGFHKSLVMQFIITDETRQTAGPLWSHGFFGLLTNVLVSMSSSGDF